LNRPILVSASLLGCGLGTLAQEIKEIEAAGSDWLHFDVMDGIFVPNISFGQPVLKAVKKAANTPIDTHLMITDPIRYIDDFVKAGSDLVTFHVESTDDADAVIDRIHKNGAKAGISIKPNTPAEAIEKYIRGVEMVLVMTVEPGFGGQGFISETVPKIAQVRKMVEASGREVYIEVDGGINAETAKICRDAGANVLVSGSYFFAAQDKAGAVRAVKGM